MNLKKQKNILCTVLTLALWKVYKSIGCMKYDYGICNILKPTYCSMEYLWLIILLTTRELQKFFFKAKILYIPLKIGIYNTEPVSLLLSANFWRLVCDSLACLLLTSFSPVGTDICYFPNVNRGCQKEWYSLLLAKHLDKCFHEVIG